MKKVVHKGDRWSRYFIFGLCGSKFKPKKYPTCVFGGWIGVTCKKCLKAREKK